MDTRKNIVYACDDNYAWILGTSMLSLLDHNHDLVIYILSYQIKQENRQRLERLVDQYNQLCQIIEVSAFEDWKNFAFRRWPGIAFARLFMAKFLPEDVENVLYLDCDTLILTDLSELWKLRMDETVFAGVKDCISKSYMNNIGLCKKEPYINAGVLFTNVSLLRNVDISVEIEQFLNQHNEELNYGDQDILNALFHDKIGVLAPEYNVMTIVFNWSYDQIQSMRNPASYYLKEEMEQARRSPAIVHFTENLLSVRPWFCNSKHPYADVFLNYMNMGPWKGKILEEKRFYGVKNTLLKFIMILPDDLAVRCVSLLHTRLWPDYIKWKKWIKERLNI